MPDGTSTSISPAEQRLDRQLLLGIALPPLAAGISTIVGYTVAHWVVIVAYKRSGYLVSAICFGLCIVAALLAWNARQELGSPDETIPRNGRRLFMADLALLLSALCALVVLAGALVLLTLRPND